MEAGTLIYASLSACASSPVPVATATEREKVQNARRWFHLSRFVAGEDVAEGDG
jgi:hypothetical protein